MTEIVVTAAPRTETGKSLNRRLRGRGLVPGIVYGASKQSVAVSVSPKDLLGVLKKGENTLFDLEVEGSRRKVIVKEYQLEPVKGTLLHADFYEVALDRPIEITVHVELTGVPVGVKVEGGILDFVSRELDVECLPGDIPEKIVVDVSELALGKHLRVTDVQPPPRVTILTDPEVVVAHVVAKRAEEVAAAPALEAAAAVPAAETEPEVIKRGRPEAEAGAEEKKDKKERK
jgi:large subunit ribosomal protein L25